MTINLDAFEQRDTDDKSERRRLRKWVRGICLHSPPALKPGPTIDSGSNGLQIKKPTVDLCGRQGLDAVHYDAGTDGWSLSPLAVRNRYSTRCQLRVLFATGQAS